MLIREAANIEDLEIFEDWPSNKCNHGHFGQGWKSTIMHPDLFFSVPENGKKPNFLRRIIERNE